MAFFSKDMCTGHKTEFFNVHGNQGKDWHPTEVNIIGSAVENQFRVSITASTVVGYDGDIALDNIYLQEGVCGGKNTFSLLLILRHNI